MGFGVVGGAIAQGRMSALRIVIGEVMADFQARFREVAEAAAVEQLGLKPTPKGLSVGVIVAVAPAAHALHGLVARH
jgi:hypothetical protein